LTPLFRTYSHHAATATDEPSRQYWISRLLFYAAKNGGPVDQRFFSLFVLIDNGLHIGDNAPPRLQEWMRDIEFAEDQIDQHGKSVPIEYRLDVVKFYKYGAFCFCFVLYLPFVLISLFCQPDCGFAG
jgi:hypothetical protein